MLLEEKKSVHAFKPKSVPLSSNSSFVAQILTFRPKHIELKSQPLWAAATRGKCPLGHRVEFPEICPSFYPSPPGWPARPQISSLRLDFGPSTSQTSLPKNSSLFRCVLASLKEALSLCMKIRNAKLVSGGVYVCDFKGFFFIPLYIS